MSDREIKPETNYNVLIFFIIVIIMIFAAWYWFDTLFGIRNESECKNIMEWQTDQIANIISNSNYVNDLFETIRRLRFLPDNSGFYFILDYSGNLYCYGKDNWYGKLNVNKTNLPVSIPFQEIIEKAKKGGGYVKYGWKGRQKSCYISPCKGKSFITCGTIFTDKKSIQQRRKWALHQKGFIKRGRNYILSKTN